MTPSLPPGPAAVIASLNLRAPSPRNLARLEERDWAQALGYADPNHLTLPFASALDASMCPSWVWERLQRNAADNRKRVASLREIYADLSGRFRRAGLEHLVMKGFTHIPWFVRDPALRTQYDLDLYFQSHELRRAVEILRSLGYTPLESLERFPTDHLPAMIRKTGWRWRGDFFDPEMPVSIEPHFRFWDRATERFGPSDLAQFWSTRQERTIGGFSFVSLDEASSLAYACLHALRHLLRGDSRPSHFHEIAWFLHRQHDAVFWSGWEQRFDTQLQRIQAICFRFAEAWFGCCLHPTAFAAVQQLPPSTARWFGRWVYAPLESPFRPNKHELWLHLSLLEDSGAKIAVARRRLLPFQPPGPVDAIHVPDSELTWRLRVTKGARWTLFVARRVFHHTRMFIPAAAAGVRWWTSERDLPPAFWRFFASFVLFNSGLLVFFLLYNLYLLELGYREDFVGAVAATFTAGNIAGSLASAFVVARLGMRNSLVLCFLATAVTLALRASVETKPWLAGFAFLGGLFQSLWAVCLSPVVAGMTNSRNRPQVFGIILSTGIGLGVVAGVTGGALPSLLGSTRHALWLAAAAGPLAVLPLLGWHPGGAAASGARPYRVDSFLLRFLAALALWGLATGAFNPFFNVFFSRDLGMPVERIGLVFSIAQLGQVAALLLAPLVYRRFGLVAGIALTQAATGVALSGLGFAPPALAGLTYVLYMSFQYMGEPGVYSLLMNRVAEPYRTGASALNVIVLFGSQAIAAWAAGHAIAAVGYQSVLITAACLALVAALVFAKLLRDP
ncbi:MAG: MFS transporter [Bryobacterales bacterium]|nr:MFS transporter [Bryobacterales bacterium]